MIAYITGASSGIGQALAELFLKKGHFVVGLSRRQTIEHSNYTHIEIDLADIKQVSSFSFPVNGKDNMILINNAGTVGPIKPIGKQLVEDIISLNNLNLIAPQVLSNQFIYQFQGNSQSIYQIINISSGAGKYPIDAWATYCASKAGIDLFSESVSKELQARNHSNWHIFSIAPGVVDTEMQLVIRQSNPDDFLNRQKFIELKENGELIGPEAVANKLMLVIESPKLYPNVVFSLRDFD